MNAETAKVQASTVAEKLKMFKAQGVTPFVVMEPTSGTDGGNLDLHHLPLDAVKSFFVSLKEDNGVTGDMMGTWTFVPEVNTPTWMSGPVNTTGATDPKRFQDNFTAMNDALKGQFPEARSAVLLNSTSYIDGDWGQPTKDASNLLPYVTGLRRVDELCFQGLAWGNDTIDPSVFLQATVATAVAARMGGPGKVSVRLNTGTYSQQTNPDTGKVDTMDDPTRKQVLVGILAQAETIKNAGYDTTIQIFGENKMPDEADWSYADPAAQAALKETLDQAAAKGITTTIF